MQVATGLLAAFIAVGASSCSSTAGAEDSAGSCIGLLVFDGRTYFWAPTNIVPSVEVGDEIGSGTFDGCEGYSGSDDEATVFDFPGAPPAQAVVLTTGAGQGYAYIATEPPAEGWDPELAAYMERAGVRHR